MFNHIIDLRPIREETGACIDVCEDVDFDAFVVGDETFTATGPARVEVTVSNVGSGFAALGTVVAPVKATCARCLCEFGVELVGEVEGLYLLPGQEADEAEMPELVSSDGHIDLGTAIQAALVIAAPFVPLHDEECAGLCVDCGADLNTEQCNCSNEAPEDHPFAGLAALLQPGEESSDESS